MIRSSLMILMSASTEIIKIMKKRKVRVRIRNIRVRRDLLLALHAFLVISLLVIIVSMLGGCFTAPYKDFGRVGEGKYIIALHVSDEVQPGADGVARNVGGLWALHSKPEFCVIVHEVAHVVYGAYHKDAYNECRRLTQ